IKITNFNLPQTINQPTGTGSGGKIVEFAEKWVNTYGDPEYVLYYEVFPKGEDTYWHPGAYTTDVLTIIGTEAGISILFDTVFLGLGKVMHITGISKAISSTFKKIFIESGEATTATGIKKILFGMGEIFTTIKGGIEKIPARAVSFLIRTTSGKVTEKGLEITTKRVVSGVLVGVSDKFSKELTKPVIKEVEETVARVFIESGENLFNRVTGKLEGKAATRVYDGLINIKGLSEEAADEIMGKLRKDVTKETFELSLSRTMWGLRISSRVTTELSDTLKAWRDIPLGKEGQDQIKNNFILANDKAKYFNSLNPNDLAIFSKNYDEIMEQVLAKQDREWATGLLEDEVGKGIRNGVPIKDMSDDAITSELNKLLRDQNP
ncbi:MAG: hypothetical protein AABW92_04925, partial [Nanoarchaeota archaeon]